MPEFRVQFPMKEICFFKNCSSPQGIWVRVFEVLLTFLMPMESRFRSKEMHKHEQIGSADLNQIDPSGSSTIAKEAVLNKDGIDEKDQKAQKAASM